MRQIQQLREIAQSTDLQVDRDGGRIVGVRILGPESVNGRQYPVDTVTKARGLYEGKQVNTDHPSRHDPNEDRSVQDRIGWLEGVAVDRAGGLVGTLHMLLSHPLTPAVMEAAERNPALFGLSHNVEGRTRREGGITIVEEITRVRSVDLVADPASTKSLFESQERPAMTVRKFFESLYAKDVKRLAILREMDELGEPVMQAEVPAEEPAAGGDATSQMKDAFRSMVMAAFDDESLDTQATIGKIKEIMKAQEKLLAGDEPATEAEGDEEEPKDEEAEKVAAAAESLIRPMTAELAMLREQIKELKGRMNVDTPMGGMRENRNGDGWTFPKDAKEAATRLIRR